MGTPGRDGAGRNNIPSDLSQYGLGGDGGIFGNSDGGNGGYQSNIIGVTAGSNIAYSVGAGGAGRNSIRGPHGLTGGSGAIRITPIKIQVIAAVGAGTWTVPSGVTKVTVELVGAGGGGGGVHTTVSRGSDGGATSFANLSIDGGLGGAGTRGFINGIAGASGSNANNKPRALVLYGVGGPGGISRIPDVTGITAGKGGDGGYLESTINVVPGSIINLVVGRGGAGNRQSTFHADQYGTAGTNGVIRLTYEVSSGPADVDLTASFSASGFGSSVPTIVTPIIDVALPDGVSRLEDRDISLGDGDWEGLANDGTYLYVLQNRPGQSSILRAYLLSDGSRASSQDKTLFEADIKDVTINRGEIFTMHYETTSGRSTRNFNRLRLSNGFLLSRSSQAVTSLPADAGLGQSTSFIHLVEAGGNLFRTYNNQFSYQSSRSFSIATQTWAGVTTDGKQVWLLNGGTREIQVYDLRDQSRLADQDIGPLNFADWTAIEIADTVLWVLNNTTNTVEAFGVGPKDIELGVNLTASGFGNSIPIVTEPPIVNIPVVDFQASGFGSSQVLVVKPGPTDLAVDFKALGFGNSVPNVLEPLHTNLYTDFDASGFGLASPVLIMPGDVDLTAAFRASGFGSARGFVVNPSDLELEVDFRASGFGMSQAELRASLVELAATFQASGFGVSRPRLGIKPVLINGQEYVAVYIQGVKYDRAFLNGEFVFGSPVSVSYTHLTLPTTPYV